MAAELSTIIINDAFRTRYFTARDMLWSLEQGKLSYLSDEPLRKWSIPQRQQFITSILNGQPQSEILIDGTEGRWLVVSGENELRAIKEFCNGQWSLPAQTADDSSTMGHPVSFKSLGLAARLKILNYKFSALMINPGVPMPNRLWIYYTRLNMMGVGMAVCRKKLFAQDYAWMSRLFETAGIHTDNIDEAWQIIFFGYIFQYDVQASDFLLGLPLDYYLSCFLEQCRELISATRNDFPDSLYATARGMEIVRKSRKKKNSEPMQQCLMALLPRLKESHLDAGRFLIDYGERWSRLSKQKKYQGHTVGSHLACVHSFLDSYGISI